MRAIVFISTALIAPWFTSIPNATEMAVVIGIVGLLQPVQARVLPPATHEVAHVLEDIVLVLALTMMAPELWTTALIVVASSLVWLACRVPPPHYGALAVLAFAMLAAVAAWNQPAGWIGHFAVGAAIVGFAGERGRLLRSETESSRKDLGHALASAGAIVHSVDMDTMRFRWIIGDVEQVTGLRGPDWETAFARAVRPGDIEAYIRRIKNAEPGTSVDATLRVRADDGTQRWLRDTSMVVRGPRGTRVIRGYLTDVTASEEARALIELRATTDALTALPNRTALDEHLAACLRTGAGGIVLVLDLNRFKEINDTLGHDVGDQVLCEVAQRLEASTRPDSVVCRLGGDEFAILCPTVTTREEAASVAARIVAQSEEPYVAGSLQLTLGCSIGVSFLREGDRPASVLRRADIAMYEAKEAREPFLLFDAAMDSYSIERLVLESDLAHALDRGEMVLHYQPKVDLRTGRVVGAEALARWEHPRLGILSPGKFLDLVMVSNQHREFTDFVVAETASAIRRCADAGMRLPIALNISIQSLHTVDFADRLLELLALHDVDPSLLTLEMTENDVQRNSAETARVLESLRSAGVQFSIDDFGTGYSSMERLRDIPVDEIKIDRTFVARVPTSERDSRIVQSVIQLADALGSRVVAEGIETTAQADALKRMGCPVAQGYLFAPAVRLDEFLQLAAESNPVLSAGSRCRRGSRQLVAESR